MKRTNNIHDKFVKASFSDAERAIAFFEKFLPDQLLQVVNLSTLKPLQESYIQADLKEYFSDIVFEVSCFENSEEKADIVLLFEHKSSPDPYVLIQLGHYMFSHWIKCLRDKRLLKPIIPVIYYQGKKKWNIKPFFYLLGVTSPQIIRYIPEVQHHFIALSSLSDETISNIRNHLMAAAVMAQKNVFDMPTLADDLAKIFRLFPENAGAGNFLETIFVYLLSAADIPKEEFIKALEYIPNDIKKNIMTTYTRIKEEGKIEGKLEGKLEGKKESITEVILKGFDNNLDIVLLANITGQSEDQVRTILVKNHKIKL